MSQNALSRESGMDTFSRALVARLNQSTEHLPHDITERLRAARVQALARRKIAVVEVELAVSMQNGVATMGTDGEEYGFWRRIASVLPLIALLAGLVSIGWIQDDIRANELAKVDAELLLDELPPAAYVDPGFIQFLRQNRGN